MLIKQLSIFVQNSLGRMAEITRMIADAGLDIRALSVADTSDFGVLRLIVDKPEVAVKELREAGLTVTLTDVIAVGMEDRPGSFADVVDVMSKAGINIEYMYAFLGRSRDRAFLILRVEEAEKGLEALRAAGASLMPESEIYGM